MEDLYSEAIWIELRKNIDAITMTVISHIHHRNRYTGRSWKEIKTVVVCDINSFNIY